MAPNKLPINTTGEPNKITVAHKYVPPSEDDIT